MAEKDPSALENPNDNPYGLIYDLRGVREPTSASEVIAEAAYTIDRETSWQFLGGSGSLTDNTYDMQVVSKRPRGAITNNDFGDLAECIEIDTEPVETGDGLHALCFRGDRTQLSDFTIILREKLTIPEDIDEDPLKQISIPLPILLFASVIGAKDSGT